jgi:hypothetical protein
MKMALRVLAFAALVGVGMQQFKGLPLPPAPVPGAQGLPLPPAPVPGANAG